MGGVTFNHVGHCVGDLDRATRFYVELLGFEREDELSVPDEAVARLLRLAPPIGLTAVSLRRDGFVLELLHYDRGAATGAGTEPAAQERRVMDEPGLTHLSLTVDDVNGLLARVDEYGGEVLYDTDVGSAVMVRDPDGQLIEILPRDRRRRGSSS